MLANELRVPIQTSFGRRPVLLFSSLICLGSMIWRARAQTYNSFMGACVLNGIGAGPAEVRLDIRIFSQTNLLARLHNRKLLLMSCSCTSEESGRLGISLFILEALWYADLTPRILSVLTVQVGPIISGPIAFHNDWRNFWWLNVALFAALIIATVFLFPETKWHRMVSLRKFSLSIPI